MEKFDKPQDSSKKVKIDCSPYKSPEHALNRLADNHNYTQLHSFVFINDISNVEKLLEQSNLVNLATEATEFNEKAGVTLLHVAAQRNHLEMTRLLLEKGANPRAVDWITETPLHYAAQRYHAKVVKVILEKDPDSIHICSRVNNTPLHAATAGDRVNPDLETIRLLAEAAGKRTINVQNDFLGHTALHDIYYYYTPFVNNKEIVSNIINCLISNGANPNAKNHKNKTPAQCAPECDLLQNTALRP